MVKTPLAASIWMFKSLLKQNLCFLIIGVSPCHALHKVVTFLLLQAFLSSMLLKSILHQGVNLGSWASLAFTCQDLYNWLSTVVLFQLVVDAVQVLHSSLLVNSGEEVRGHGVLNEFDSIPFRLITCLIPVKHVVPRSHMFGNLRRDLDYDEPVVNKFLWFVSFPCSY